MSRKNMVIPKGLTRSKKKKYVNQQIAIAKGMHRMLKKISEASKYYAKILTKRPSRTENVMNRLGFCPDCKMYYCFNFAGGISWCHECAWRTSCLKLTYPEEALLPEDKLIIRQCKPCYWDELDRMRNELSALGAIVIFGKS